MNRSIFATVKPGLKTLVAGVLGWALLAGGTLNAQTELVQPPSSMPGLAVPATSTVPSPQPAIFDPMVKPASGCCNLPPLTGLGDYGGGGCGSGGCCGNGGCVPGRRPCDLGCFGASDSCVARFFGGLCQEICCPDPCYEPAWIPAANAAFFQDGPRPVTQTRIRWDAGFRYGFPDSAEFFWAQENMKGPGLDNKGNKHVTTSLNYDSLSLYQEVAAKGASVFVEIPYLSISPEGGAASSAGFGDMNIGVKTVVLDRDLILVTTQFRTFIPIGNPMTGLGTGHVSLEPALLMALKLTATTYLQAEIADWIPLGGDPGFAGAVFHYHVSLNQNLCHIGECFNLVGTMEFNGYSFRGQFTDGAGLVENLSGSNFYSAGPGFRAQFCDRCDIGVGAAYGFGTRHGPDQLYRTELRIRY